MSNIDWSQLITKAMKDQAAADQVIIAQTGEENAWRETEILAISNQLMALEEQEAGVEDSGALPGTRLEWLQYRTKVRNWKEGHPDFPDMTARPVQPA
jgi:hypothetical protein